MLARGPRKLFRTACFGAHAFRRSADRSLDCSACAMDGAQVRMYCPISETAMQPAAPLFENERVRVDQITDQQRLLTIEPIDELLVRLAFRVRGEIVQRHEGA
jgi:hypothetical protein